MHNRIYKLTRNTISNADVFKKFPVTFFAFGIRDLICQIHLIFFDLTL